MEHVSLMDMLPEREGIVPDGSSGAAPGHKCIGLYETKCACCGKRFEYYGKMHRYRAEKRRNREAIFCSYGCMRAWERELEQEEREKEEKAARRAAKRIEQIVAQMNDPAWKTLARAKRTTLCSTLDRCRGTLQDYEAKYGEEIGTHE